MPSNAFKYTGAVATRVLPSPVPISAMLPRCRIIPPISWTSNCLIPNTRREASLMTANASGRISSKVSPFASRALNSLVLFAKEESLSFFNADSCGLIFSSTSCRIFFISRSLEPLNKRSKNLLNIKILLILPAKTIFIYTNI